MKEKITRLGVWREKMTHIGEKSGKIFSLLGARVRAEGIFILWGQFIYGGYSIIKQKAIEGGKSRALICIIFQL